MRDIFWNANIWQTIYLCIYIKYLFYFIFFTIKRDDRRPAAVRPDYNEKVLIQTGFTTLFCSSITN